jgi:hypothetical protein
VGGCGVEGGGVREQRCEAVDADLHLWVPLVACFLNCLLVKDAVEREWIHRPGG